MVGADGTPKNCCVSTIMDSCTTSCGVVQGRRRGGISVDAGSEWRLLISPSVVQATIKTRHALKRCSPEYSPPVRYGLGVACKA